MAVLRCLLHQTKEKLGLLLLTARRGLPSVLLVAGSVGWVACTQDGSAESNCAAGAACNTAGTTSGESGMASAAMSDMPSGGNAGVATGGGMGGSSNSTANGGAIASNGNMGGGSSAGNAGSATGGNTDTQNTGGVTSAAGGNTNTVGAGDGLTGGAGASGSGVGGMGGAAMGGNGGGNAAEGRVLGEPNASAPNPIITHIFTADPSADSYNGRIYVYTSHDLDDQMAYDMYDYHVFSSDDLVNWQDHGVILDAREIDWATYLWAPDCVYSAKNDKYYLYFPNGDESIGVAVADTPEGPFEDALGQALIDANTPGVSDVDWIFDPTAFIDDDGQAYLYFGGGPNGDDDGDNARVIKLNDDMISIDGSAVTIPAPEFFEASFMHKRDDKYYFSYSGDFRSHAAWIEYMISDNPMTGFEYAGTVLKEPDNNNGNNNHHSILEYQGEWYIFYHNRVLSNRLGGYSDYQRSITLDHLSYDADGNINPVPTVMGEVKQLKAVDGLVKIEGELLAGQGGVETDSVLDSGQRVVVLTDLQDGDWSAVSQVDFANGVSTMHARVASANGASIEVLQDGCPGFRENSGSMAGSCEVSATGGEQSFVDIECAVNISGGVHDLCLRYAGAGQQLLSLDYYWFE